MIVTICQVPTTRRFVATDDVGIVEGMNALVVTFDHLPLRMLGCYGNDWIATPHFDRLAVESVVFDANFTDTTEPNRPSNAWWTGRHRLQTSQQPQESRNSLGQRLREAGVRTTLLAEACDEQSIPLPEDFDELVGPMDSCVELVTTAIQTIETFSNDMPSHLLWLKSRGIPRDWVSSDVWNEVDLGLEPVEAAQLLQQAAESGFSSLTTTDRTLVRRAYGACVMWLDESLGRFLEACHSRSLLDDCLLIVAAGMGDDLGEQADIGEASSPSLSSSLRGELIQGPLFVRIPSAEVGTRRRALVQTIDMVPTICDWFGLPVDLPNHAFEGDSLLPIVRGETEAVRDHLLIAGDGARAIRTADFQLNQDDSDVSEAETWLFTKPEDRWDVLDVADQYPAVVAELSEALADPNLESP